MAWSDYLVFVDESGDHGLDKIDPQYPVFVLLFCLVEKTTYASAICTELQRFEYEFFGRDTVILHEYDIRKAYGPFSILQNASVRDRFMSAITTMITAAPVTVFASVIHKVRLKERYATPGNPYHLGMQFGLERLHHALRHLGQADRETFVICESRGRREDDELELEFRRVCDGRTSAGRICLSKSTSFRNQATRLGCSWRPCWHDLSVATCSIPRNPIARSTLHAASCTNPMDA
jgi:hypothetical protein